MATLQWNESNEPIQLDDDENILWRGKPEKTPYLINSILGGAGIALIWLLFDGVFIFTIVGSALNGGIPKAMIVFLIGFFAIHLIPVWMWLAKAATAKTDWRNTEYIVTDKRITAKHGAIQITYDTVMYKDIKHVHLIYQFTDRIMGVGDIHIEAFGKGCDIKFLDIKNPQVVYNNLQRFVRDIQSDIQYPNALRPEENPGYNTHYRGR